MTAKPRRPRHKLLVAVGLRRALGLSALICGVLSAPSAGAQSAAGGTTAQALFDTAKKLMKSGKYAEACPALEESQRIEARSGTALNLADCYEHQGRLASAWSTFLEAAALAKTSSNPAREKGARDRAAALVPRLSNLLITAAAAQSNPDLQITRDGERVGPAQLELPLPTDAGEHTIAASAPGRKPWQTVVTVAGAASTTKVIVPDLEHVATPAVASRPERSPNPPPAVAPSETTAPGVNGAVIAGSLVTGALAVGTVVTSILYKSKLHDYDNANKTAEPNNARDLLSQTRAMGALNLALLGGTVVAAGVTVVLWASASPHENATNAGVELRGRFAPGWAGLSLGGRL
jgi:tetratricopeptide (TPR) repeat protein